jgi:hypothetical protein
MTSLDIQVAVLLTISPYGIGLRIFEDGQEVGRITPGKTGLLHGWQWVKDRESSQLFRTKADAFEAFANKFYSVAASGSLPDLCAILAKSA